MHHGENMKLKKAIIAPNPRKNWAHVIAREMHDFLRARGISVTSTKSNADFMITIGGDGTVLREKRHTHLPIFAIGSVSSYFCQARNTNWRSVLSEALERPAMQRRMMLSSWLNGVKMEDALNEVFVRNWDHRVLDFDLRANGSRSKFLADGVIFSTPTGSSAYAYSAGGRQLAPTSKNYEIVGLAPYRRAFKPIVAPESTVCRLTVTTKRPGFAVIDGQFSHKLRSGKNSLVVKRSKQTVDLLWWR